MILNPEWLKPKEKPYFHQISMDCLGKLVDCIGRLNKGEIDADTSCQIERQILTDEIQDQEFLNFAVENISELFGYLATGRVNIRICRDITGEMWFGVGCYMRKSKMAEYF
jgi:hypothetical protein